MKEKHKKPKRLTLIFEGTSRQPRCRLSIFLVLLAKKVYLKTTKHYWTKKQQQQSVSNCRESRVESKMSRVEGNMSRVEGNLKKYIKIMK